MISEVYGVILSLWIANYEKRGSGKVEYEQIIKSFLPVFVRARFL